MPAPLPIQWQISLSSISLGGLAADERIVIVSSRDALDERDIFSALDIQSGKLLWQMEYKCKGKMDYGRAPRATPLIVKNQIVMLGAFGHLNCVDRNTGVSIWTKNLGKDFGAKLPIWGFCGSPLLIDDSLLVQTGSSKSSIVRLGLDGKTVWTEGGEPISYSSFVEAAPNGVRQLIGYDETTVGGWNVDTGKRIWTITPAETGDFNVVTPIVQEERLWLFSENNGARLYRFVAGRPAPEPQAENLRIVPDTHTPVLIGNRLYCVNEGLFCLNADTLEPIWESDDDVFRGHASMFATDSRLMILTQYGDLVLVDVTQDEYIENGRVHLGKGDFQSHPALVGDRLIVRKGKEIVCYQLK